MSVLDLRSVRIKSSIAMKSCFLRTHVETTAKEQRGAWFILRQIVQKVEGGEISGEEGPMPALLTPRELFTGL